MSPQGADPNLAKTVDSVAFPMMLKREMALHVLGIPGRYSLNLMTSHGGLTTLDRYEDGVWVVQAVNAPAIRQGPWGGRTFKP